MSPNFVQAHLSIILVAQTSTEAIPGSFSALGQKSFFDIRAGLVIFMINTVSTLLFTRVLERNGDPFPFPSAPKYPSHCILLH